MYLSRWEEDSRAPSAINTARTKYSNEENKHKNKIIQRSVLNLLLLLNIVTFSFRTKNWCEMRSVAVNATATSNFLLFILLLLRPFAGVITLLCAPFECSAVCCMYIFVCVRFPFNRFIVIILLLWGGELIINNKMLLCSVLILRNGPNISYSNDLRWTCFGCGDGGCRWTGRRHV